MSCSRIQLEKLLMASACSNVPSGQASAKPLAHAWHQPQYLLSATSPGSVIMTITIKPMLQHICTRARAFFENRPINCWSEGALIAGGASYYPFLSRAVTGADACLSQPILIMLGVYSQVTDVTAMAEKAHVTAHELKDSHGPAIDSLEARMVRLEASAYPLSQRSSAGKEDAGHSTPAASSTGAPAASSKKETNIFANWTPAQEHLVQVTRIKLLCVGWTSMTAMALHYLRSCAEGIQVQAQALLASAGCTNHLGRGCG